MRKQPVVVVALALTGCDSAAENAVKALLTDPESAQFSAVSTQGNVTCGLVNAKRPAGGYAGPSPFIVESGVAELASSDLEALDEKFVKKCPKKSYDEMLSVSLSRYNQTQKDERGY